MRARLQDWLTGQAQCRPEGSAIVFRGQATTYADLECASNRLARALRAAGCVRGDRVGLLLPKSRRALVAMFGALKADCAYVPLDTTAPCARIDRILALCECRCLLAEQSTAGVLRDLAADGGAASRSRILWMDRRAGVASGTDAPSHWDDIETFSDAPVDSRNSSADAAHILFTSGSTGMPKGVVITHANVIHFVRWAVRHFGINPSDRVSGHPPLHFDLSTFDIYGTIAAGAQIHLLTPEMSLLPHRLADFIRDAELTQWFSVPSALLPMAKFDVLRPNDFPALRRLLWCGEKFPTPALIYWMKRLPRVAFYNLYGPTETTIASSYYHLPRCPPDERAEIPIGAACDGERLLVLNDRLVPCERGEIGDLYIGGVGLSPGYWNDPAKTADVFHPSQPGADSSDRIYKTGDLARIGDDGLIYLVGRADTQVKIRGFRIELGEIEAAVHAVSGVQDAAVVAVDSPATDGPVICCAFVTAPLWELSPLALQREVGRLLPHYMIPTDWMALPLMPRNQNGKTDRVQVKQWFLRDSEAGRPFAKRQALRATPRCAG